MRIIGGSFRSRKIKYKIPDNIRPTSDRVRETMFNILNNLIDFENCLILDLFSGTGALGFESLSRGAENVTFVEKNRKSIDIIKNIALDLEIPKNQYSIINSDVIKYLRNIDSITQYDIIFADPPYHSNIYNDLFEIIVERDILKKDALFIVEFGSSMKIPELSKYNLLSAREIGDTSFAIYTL